MLELVRACVSPDEADESLGLPARTLVMTTPELAAILGWERLADDNKHPLYCIDKLLQVSLTRLCNQNLKGSSIPYLCSKLIVCELFLF